MPIIIALLVGIVMVVLVRRQMTQKDLTFKSISDKLDRMIEATKKK